MSLHTFRISYFAEVSAVIELHDTERGFCATATHPRENVPISDWFHFCDAEWDLPVVGRNAHETLKKLGDELYPGAGHLLEMAHDNPRERFFSDLYIAFTYGNWHPRNPDNPDIVHPVGRWLMNYEYED